MKLKKAYFEDIELFEDKTHLFWTVVLLAFLTCLPFLAKSYYLNIINLMAINAIIALGLNLLVGNTGQISLGHAGFVAIGAYTAAVLSNMGIPFFGAFLAGGLLAALFGVLLGIPSLKLEGPYLAIATLAFGLAITVIIGRLDFLGGRMGLEIEEISLAWTGLHYDTAFYFLVVFLTIFLVIFMRSILQSRIGRAFQAIRDSDIAAPAIGINLTKYKLLSFALSALFAGFGGALLAYYYSYISPMSFTFIQSITFLATIVLGGLGFVSGSVMGAIVMTFLTIQLQNIVDVPVLGPLLMSFSEWAMEPSAISNVSWVFTGLILILIILFEPLGLYGIWLRIKKYWKTWPF